MDIIHKIKLVEILRLRPADLETIDSINFSDECLKGLLKNDKDMLDKEIDSIVNNENNDDKKRLVAASLKSILM